MPVSKQGIHWFLTDEEVEEVRKELTKLRASGRNAPGKSFVSGLNFLPEVMGLSMPTTWPEKVTIRDITLRTAEQSAGIAITPDERRRLAKALVDIGIRSIQPTVNGWGRQKSLQELQEEIAFIKGLNPEVEIATNGVDTIDAMDNYFAVGVDAPAMAIPSAIAISAFYVGSADRLAWEGRDWRKYHEEHAKGFRTSLDQLKRLVDHAHKRGKTMETKLSMLLYATPEIIDQFTREMGDAGADVISFADGPSAMTPNAVAYVIMLAKKNAPHARVGIHLHNTFNTGVALNMAAAQAGADIFEVAVNGYCSGPGQADEQQVIAALEILCGIDTGIDLVGLTDLRRLGEDISRIKMGRSHPITGDEAFNWGGADDVMLELQVDPLIHLAVAPDVVGNVYSTSIEGSIVDRSSGPWAVMNKLDELGLRPEREEVEHIHAALQDELLVRKRSLTNEEIRELAVSVVPRLATS